MGKISRPEQEGPIKAEIITDEKGFYELKQDWDFVLSRSSTNNVFMTHEWMSTWWKHFGKELRVVVARKEGKIIAIAPLMLTRRNIMGYRCKCLELIGTPIADQNDIIMMEGEDCYKEIYDSLASYKGWNILRLAEIPEHSPTLKHPWENHIKRLTEVCPSMVFEKEKNIFSLLKKRDIRRKEAQLSALDQISYEYLKSSDKDSIDLLFQMHADRWKGDSAFVSNEQRKFFKEVFSKFEEQGWFSLFCMKLGNDPIAFHLTFPYKEKNTAYITTYDQKYHKQSPGTISLKYNLENSLGKYSEYDLSRGDEFYKKRFTNTVRKNYELIIPRTRLAAAALKADTFLRKTARTIIKKT